MNIEKIMGRFVAHMSLTQIFFSFPKGDKITADNDWALKNMPWSQNLDNRFPLIIQAGISFGFDKIRDQNNK